MPLQEKRYFIEDESADMEFKEKNLQLSAALATQPLLRRKIVKIDRIEIGAQGWWVTYREGTP